MKRYFKGLIGGILAILAAFGWTVAAFFVIVTTTSGIFTTTRSSHTIIVIVMLPVFAIFAIGFCLAFRSTYK